MEALKIAATCVLAAILYGIIHDQFTARICIEYFTVFHPPIFDTQSPMLLGIGWGIIATWWVGAFFAVPIILGRTRWRQTPAAGLATAAPNSHPARIHGWMCSSVRHSRVPSCPLRSTGN